MGGLLDGRNVIHHRNDVNDDDDDDDEDEYDALGISIENISAPYGDPIFTW